jgi:acyl-CoA thioester hydrolase
MTYALPSIEQLRELDAQLTTRVRDEWADHNGHVNIRGHFDLHAAASDVLFDRLGFDEAYRAGGSSVFSVDHRIRYHGELHVGHDAAVHVRLIDRSAKIIHGVSALVDVTTGQLASTLEFMEIHVDLASRRSSPMSSTIAVRVDALLDRHRGLTWQLPPDKGMGLR